jgi:hypothetical protein
VRRNEHLWHGNQGVEPASHREEGCGGLVPIQPRPRCVRCTCTRNNTTQQSQVVVRNSPPPAVPVLHALTGCRGEGGPGRQADLRQHSLHGTALATQHCQAANSMHSCPPGSILVTCGATAAPTQLPSPKRTSGAATAHSKHTKAQTRTRTPSQCVLPAFKCTTHRSIECSP